MDFKEWIGATEETEFTLDPELFRSYQEEMERDGFLTDEGDPLPPFAHWFYLADQNNEPFAKMLQESEDLNIFWRSGKLSVNSALVAGQHCKSVLKIRDIDSIDEDGHSALITLHQRVLAGRSAAIEEELKVLVTENSEEPQKRRRINFDPDWELEIDQNRAKKYLTLEPGIFGRTVSGLLSGLDNSEKKSPGRKIRGLPGMVLLLESFSENFESRKIESFDYKSFPVETIDSLTVACRDTDTYQTSMRLIDSHRRVIFSTEIQWNYAW